MKQIKYTEGYKYQLEESYTHQIPNITLDEGVRFEETSLGTDGLLIIKAGFAWDGPSGPTADTPDSMRGSLVHDALYRLMSEGLLSTDFRDEADDVFYAILREDGMNRIRAKLWYYAVKNFAEDHADPVKGKREVLTAP